MNVEALVFDVDGTLADTEEAHRRAFNAAFREHGLDWKWSRSLYGELLEVTGGKERITHYIESRNLAPDDAERLKWMVPCIHRTKTLHFTEFVEAGEISLRPGVNRLISEALDAGIKLAIASTTTLDNIRALIVSTLGFSALARFNVIASGDVVPEKKPAPDIYRYVLSRLRLAPQSCIAFEDSEIGRRSAKSAGLFTVVTPTSWTRTQCFDAADLLLRSLGESTEPLGEADARRLGGQWLSIEVLDALHNSRTFPPVGERKAT